MLSLRVEEKLEMRLVADRYEEELYEAIREDLDHLHHWMQWAVSDYDRRMTRAFIKDSRRQFADGKSVNLLIFDRNVLAGGIGFNFLDTVNKWTELGYWLGEKHTGRGIVTKCSRVLIDNAFDEYEMQRVVIRCAKGNQKSRAVPERLGFTEEGTMRNAEWLHDRFEDLVVYSVLRDEWMARRGKH